MSQSHSVYLVEVYFDGDGDPGKARWIPMYQVCYSRREAIDKAKSKKYSVTRVSRYEFAETFPETFQRKE